MLRLRNPRELYRTAFQGGPKDYYTGINPASKSLFLGEPAEAARLASLVLPLVATAIDGKDLWPGSTLGEVYLLQGKVNEAAAQYQSRHRSLGAPQRLGDAVGANLGRTALHPAGSLGPRRHRLRKCIADCRLALQKGRTPLAPAGDGEHHLTHDNVLYHATTSNQCNCPR